MPARFSFSLQKVLDLRAHHEEQAALDFSKKKAALEYEKKMLNALHEKKEEVMNNAEKDEERADLRSLIIVQNYINDLNGKIDKKKEQVSQKNKLVKKSLAELTEAVKKKKIMEKLKEHKYEEHKKKNRLSENKLIDEVAIRNAGQSRRMVG